MSLVIQEVVKRYGRTAALEGCSLEVQPGELLSLVGPSGCGKSTLLNVIAGFVVPDQGSVEISGKKVDNLPVRDRKISYVMAGLGLYPHLCVDENVAYPLRIRKMENREIARRVASICDLTGLGGLEKRRPAELSSGQQQRVAVARAFVREDAEILLADECFSALDAPSRFELRGEFRTWQRALRRTCVFVTHDQEEALALGDRVALMQKGKIDQIGTANELYERPKSLFAGRFLGRPEMNILALVDKSGQLTEFGQAYGPQISQFGRVEELTLGVRPEDIKLNDTNGIQANVEWIEPLNPDALIHMQVGQQKVIARVRGTADIPLSGSVRIRTDKSCWHMFSRATELRVEFGDTCE